MLGIELRQKAQPCLEALLTRGVLALPAGPNVIRLLPPLVISQAQLAHVIETIEEVLEHNGANVVGRGASLPPPFSHSTAESVLTTASHESLAEIALLHNMLTIPSYSGQEATLARFLVEQARAMGLDALVDEAGNFVARVAPAGSTEAEFVEPVILLGHMDTVRGNIPVRIEEGRLYGRGAVDAKGPLAAFLCAAARLARSGEQLQRPLFVIGAVEEEAATSRGARAVIGRYTPAACIIGEPSGSSAITLGYKGRLLVEYCLRRPLSHSAGPQASSGELATAFWQRVRTHADEWNRQHAGDSAFASLQPSLRSINNEQDGLEDSTRLLIGYRLPPAFDIAALRSQLQAWAREQEEGAGDDVSCTLTFSGEEQAFQSTRTTPLARIMSRAIRAGGGQPIFKLKTGTSDMNVVGSHWGNNIVAYGPGDSRLDHTPQEHIVLSEYLQAIDVLERALRELTVAPTPSAERGSVL
jgi:N-acetyl-ornithine/N-acetyl-lysine deacetylase